MHEIASFLLLGAFEQQYIRPEDLFWREITVPRKKGSQPLCIVAQTDAKTVDQPNAGGKALCIPLQIARKKYFFAILKKKWEACTKALYIPLQIACQISLACNFVKKERTAHESVIYTTPNRTKKISFVQFCQKSANRARKRYIYHSKSHAKFHFFVILSTKCEACTKA